MDELYFDHHAASPLDPRVADAMRDVLCRPLGNPASPHAAGRRARALLEEARARIAAAVGARPAEIVLTSGGTEACNLGVLGLSAGRHVVTTAIEHPAVAEPVRALARGGARITVLGLPAGAIPDAALVARALADGADLLAAQWVGHETGIVLPIPRWCALASDRGVLSVVDATQALGKLAIDFPGSGATAMALASHKIGGPAGAGALVLRRGITLEPRVLGGAQERGLRAGTPDVVAIVGFGAACALVHERLAAQPAIARRRDRLEAALAGRGARVNGGAERVATVTDVSLPGWTSQALVAALDLEGLEVASGAACSSGVDRPSAVVAAMFPDEPARAASAIRVSLGRETTDDDVDRAIAIFDRVLARPPA